MLFLFLILSGLVSHLSAAAMQAPARGPKIWLGDNQALPVKPVGAPTLAQSVAAGQAQPTAMATADVDGDGVADMIAGFSVPGGGMIVIHRGNLDAFAPQSDASFQAIGRGQFPAPFLPNAKVFSVPVRPDFIALGRFTPSGHQDLAVAALGGNSLYVFPGDGKGGFGAPQTVAVSGSITAMASENLLRSLAYSNLVVGTATPQTSSLLVFSGTDSGLSPPAVFRLAAAASNIVFGDFGDSHTDTAFLSGGNVFILHSATFQIEALSLPVNASAMALGSFIFDRNGGGLQIALLTSDGSLHIAAHTEFDPRMLTTEEHQARLQAGRRGMGNPLDPPRMLPQNGFKIVESIASAAPFSAGQPPVMFRTRISDHGADDVMVLNPSMGQLAVIAHPDVAPGATTFLPAIVSTRPYSGSPVAALPMRTNIDGRPGVVALHAGQLAPAVMMPLPDPTFTVNRTDDPVPVSPITNACNGVANDCSLREAILRANAIAGTDTITVPAGTYTLTLPRVSNDCTGNHGALSVNDSLNIVGAGQATTIIQAGTSNATGVDMVMNVNEDLVQPNCPVTNATASLSNLTLKFGHNRGTVGNFDGDGGCMEFDTGSSGTANLSLDHVTLTDCSTTDGNGGGIAIFNVTSPGTGQPTITNSIFQNNSVAEIALNGAGSGGAVWVSDLARMSMSNSQILNNNANQINGTGRGVGGGLFIFSAGSGSRLTVLHSNTITGNNASGDGGGIWDTSNLLIDNGGTPTSLTVISGNTAGGNGGGIHYHAVSPDVMTLTKLTITGNTATGNGGGIDAGEPSLAHAFTMSFSRLAGNTAPTGKNLNNNHTTATVTNNWWGVNTPATTISNINTGATTFDPFIQLTHVASPSTIKINASTALNADMSKDNHGSGAALAGNLDVIVGLPITFNNPVLGTIPQAQPETLNASAQATATFNAGGVSGHGSADATVDQATVTAPIIILEPLQITKSFSPNPVAVNASSTLTFAVNNPNVIAVDANFTDTLPAGLVVAATPGITNSCGGTVTAVAGSGLISFTNGSLPIGACSISVKVSSPTDNVYSNSVTINSTAAGTGPQSTSSASLTVINPPSITKAFGVASIPLNGTTSLTFTLNSTNANLTLNGVAFTDSLPAGLVVATPGNLNTTCNGTATAADGSSSISLSGASLAPGANCTVSVNVTGTTAGVKNNSVQVISTNAGTGNTSNASLTVVAPPTISKAFNPTSIALNASSTLSFTITNPNTASALSGVGFSDTLPAGLVVAATPNITGSCGSGTITATAGSSTISLSGGTLTASPAAGSSCTFSVSVTGTTAGAKNNTSGNVTSTEGGTGGTASASISVVAPPSIAKVFNPATIALNATTSLQFTITNPAANTVALTGVAFSDTLPTGLTVANTSAAVCGGTLTTTAPTGIALTGATIPVNSQCVFSVTVTGAASGQYTNTTGSVTSTNGGTGNTASANLTVATPPSILKSFGAASIPLNGSTSLSFTITNPNTGVALSGVAFTDNLPSGLVVATPNGLTGTCGSGTITATAGSGTVSLSGGTLTASPAAGSSCTFSVNVTGTTAGVKNNSVQVTSTEGGTGNTSNASITVVGAPVISKAFGAASIPLNGSTSLSFTIQNNNTTTTLTGVGFSDTLPAGLVISTPNGLTGTCGGGTITATAGTNVISLTGATLAASASCTFSVNVTGISAGTQNNTSGNVTSTEGGTGGTASASINVVAPPSIAKVFNPATISLNATTSLTFTITNPAANTVALTGVAFTDTLPTGLTVANASATVCGGTLTTTAPTGIALTGATIAVNSQCQFSVTVTGAASGNYTNTTGSVTSTNGGTGNTASANLTVAAAPTITKSFGAAQIPLNGTTSLSFSITNPNTNVALTGVAFNDTLPAGLIVATPSGLTTTCSGTATAVAGSSSVSLSGGTLATSASCTVSLNVQGVTAGVKNNSVQVTSTEGGTGNTSNASITVVAPPVIIKAFGAASIPLNGSTLLSFTIQNNNTTTTLTGVGFSDTLPAGLVISTPNGQTGTCGTGTITATAGTNVISLTGGTLAASTSCTFSVNVTGIAPGTQNNTTGNVTSTEGGTGGTASASIVVIAAPPTITKFFGAASIPLNGTTSLTFNITNPNPAGLTGVAFTDTLPAGLVVATPNALNSTCGGTATAVAGSSTISLSAGTLAASASCTLSVNVTGITAGVKNNSVVVTSTEGGTGNTSNASITVVGAPVIIKAFGAASIPLNGSTSLTFTIQNNNTTTPLTGVGFTDTLPAGLVISTPNGQTGTCGTGTITATAGTNVISLTGAALAASASCTFSVNVTGTTAGTKNNTTGNVTSTEGGTGGTASASIDVVAPPSIAKAFGAAAIPLNGTTSLTFTITNPAGNTVAENGVAFTDALPAGLVVATPNGLTNTCGGTATAVAGSGNISLTGGTIAAGSNCILTVNVTGTASGNFTNTTGNVSSTNGGTGNTATANLSVATPPTITKSFGAATILLNGSTSLSFTINNPNASSSLTGVAFTDSLPAGLIVSTPNGLSGSCGGGTITAAAGSSAVSLSGATLAGAASCTFSVNVTGTIAGVDNNSVQVTATESGPGNTSNASITVIAPPSIAKAFGAASINLNATTTLTFTITNPNTTVALVGVGFGDTLPAGLAVATPNGLTGSCGAGTITTGSVSGFSVVNLSGGTIAASSFCTFSVNVVGQTAGHKVNTTGIVSSTNAGSGNQATATIDVNAPDLAITKTHIGTFHRGQTGAQYIITVSNVGFGPTVGTVTVVDNLPVIGNPHNIVPTALSGTGWTCTLATLTCTRADALASGSSYPVITMTVDIPTNITNNFTNTATVSGGGDVNINNNTASDPVSLGPPIVITPHATTASVVAGSSTTFIFDVDDQDPTQGVITFGCGGLPVGTACSFSPANTTQPLTTVTMTITTSNGRTVAAARNSGMSSRSPLYAALLFPVFGMVGIAFSGRRGRKARLRFALVVIGALALLSFAGCGSGLHGIVTPAGNYQLSVSASSATVQVSTPVTLSVK
jgi:uncharacterized repeat protein (TIGR01451 family)